MGGDITARKFSELLLKIGDEKYPDGKLIIPEDLGQVVTTLPELTVNIYPIITDLKNKSIGYLYLYSNPKK